MTLHATTALQIVPRHVLGGPGNDAGGRLVIEYPYRFT